VAGVIAVCPDGVAPYGTIASAIAAAAAGSTIEVCPGTYAERLLVLDKPLQIVGTGGAAVTILDAGSGGTALVVQNTGGSGLAIRGFTIRNGRADGTGGGIRCSSSTLTLADDVLTANEADGGGGLAAAACSVNVSATTFDTNKGGSRGGGALLVGCSGTVGGSIFARNDAVRGGGLTIEEGSVVVQNNEFRSNVALLAGGGLYHESDALIEANIIADNTSWWTGGGVYLGVHKQIFRGNTVSGNTSTNDGGGIYVHMSETTIVDNRFQNNYSGDDGGGIRIFESNCRIEDNLVEQNTANDTGGGIRISHLPCQVINNIVRNNTATYTGGGMDLDNDSSVVRGGEITGNKASKGGGIFMWLAPWDGARIEGVLIANNSAWRGGGIHLDDNFQPVALNRLTVIDNTAAEGGGMFLRATTFSLNHSVFERNKSLDRGGALYIGANGNWNQVCPCPPTDPIGRISFIVAHANQAPDGAGLWTSYANLVVANSILFNNVGGSSVTAGGAPATPSVVVLPQYNYNSTEPATFSGMASPIETNGNIAQDPLFVNVASGDFHLNNTSACVNAGDPAITDADGSRADMGLFGGRQ